MQTGEEAVLLLSRQDQLDMIENYSEYFEVEFSGTYTGTFRLRDTVSSGELEKLKERFRWTMTVRLFEAFMSPDALQKLGRPAPDAAERGSRLPPQPCSSCSCKTFPRCGKTGSGLRRGEGTPK